MRNLKSLALAAVGCVFVAGSLSAQTGTGWAQWRGVNGYSSGCYYGGPIPPGGCYPTDPYYAGFQIDVPPTPAANLPFLPTAAINSGFGPTEDIFCVNFTHEADESAGGYQAYFTNLGHDVGAVGVYTRNHSLRQYLESAWLAQGIMSNGASSATALDMQGAIWQIMSGPPGPTYPIYRDGSNTQIAYWVAQAMAGWTGTDMAGSEAGVTSSSWVVVTDYNAIGQDDTGSQEYLTQIVTPEPATMLLLGTGLLVMLLGTGALRRPTA